MRKIFGTIAGVLIAFLLVTITDLTSSALFPAGTLDTADPTVVAAYVAGLPLVAKLIVVSGWLIAPFGGAWLCLRINDWQLGGWIVTAVFLAGGLVNQLSLPHPLWMQICSVVLPFLGGLLARRLHHKPYPGEPLLG